MNGLKPSDFKIYEDGIVQKLNTFAEGGKPPVGLVDDGRTQPLTEVKTEGSPGLDRPDAFGLPISYAAWAVPIPSRSTRLAGTFPAGHR